MASIPTKQSGQTCAFPGCNKPTRARGFCVACYYRQLRAGEIVSGTPTERFRHRLSDIDSEVGTAICAVCGPTKVYRRSGGGKQFRCGTEANERSKLYKRAYRASRKVVMGDECEICGNSDNLRWDHDHATEEYRGTLCNTCNLGLGSFRDDPELLMKAAKYLHR